MTLWLVGMMGSGKTSAGELAASSLGVAFFDTDDLVAERAGTSLVAVWESGGEKGFRAREREAVSAVAGRVAVVATGGGVVLSGENRSTMTASGPVVWLDAPVEVLASRLGSGQGRPLLGQGDPLQALLPLETERRELYRAVARHRIDTALLTQAEVAARIEALWPS